jgi:hypothetical protein
VQGAISGVNIERRMRALNKGENALRAKHLDGPAAPIPVGIRRPKSRHGQGGLGCGVEGFFAKSDIFFATEGTALGFNS